MIRKSFPLRVLAISFIVLALPLLINSFIFFQIAYNDSVADAKQDLKEVGNFRASALLQLAPVKQVLLQEIEMLLELQEKIKQLPNKKINQELVELGELQNAYEIYVLGIGEGGNYPILASSVAAQVGENFISYTQMNAILKSGAGNFFRYVYSEETGEYSPHIFIARTIYQENSHKPLGILMVSSVIKQEIAPLLVMGGEHESVEFAILDKDGIVFFSTNGMLDLQYFQPISALRIQQIRESKQLAGATLPKKPVVVVLEEDSLFFEFKMGNKIYIAYRAPIQDNGFNFIAYSTKDKIFGKSLRQFVFIYVTYALILVIGAGVTYLFSLWMARPLRQLSALMGKVSEGDLSGRFKKERFGFEINSLGEIFNQTLVALLENIQKAEDERVQKEMYQKELSIGQEAQQNLLPKVREEIWGLEVAETYLPAEEVGGDFYDVFVKRTETNKEVLVVTVADAAGKGVSACLYALGVRSMLRTHAILYDDLGMILKETNNLFIQDTGETGMFVTVLSGIFDPETKTLSYYSCGHVPGFVRRKNGEILELTHTGMAMGLQEIDSIKSAFIQLETGDLVIFYTDGIIDITNPFGHPFTKEKFKECLQQRPWQSAKEVVDGIVQEAKRHTQESAQERDITLLVMKVL